jgi:ParB family transcriptional regulator, chromosome partitioning protein
MNERPSMKSEKRPALGRGLSALIPEAPLVQSGEVSTEVDLDLLTPNPRQPRLTFGDERLDELAASIKANGVIQPIIVRRQGNRFEIVAGERRWRAAQRAGLLKVPVVVRDVPDAKLLEMALIENIQRENLNPIDQAQAYRRLVEELQMTQEQVANAVGKDRASVANYLRLLNLPEGVRARVADERLSMGHARALLALESDEAVERAAATVETRGLSVRETEALVRRMGSAAVTATPGPTPDVHTRHAEERLRMALGTRVRIVRKGEAGRLEIEFVSEDELQRLYEQLTRG